MRCGVELALAQGSITLGDQLWKQQRGVPIGGMVSKCSCSVTLGMSEQIWSETHGKQFKGHLATTRYVDDLVVLSPDTCRDCITNLLKTVYPAGVEFEAQSGCEWLDMNLRIDAEGELVISAKQTESDWVYGRVTRVENMYSLRTWETLALTLGACGAKSKGVQQDCDNSSCDLLNCTLL